MNINSIKAKENRSYIITENGRVYSWPITKPNGDIIYRPVELAFPEPVKIVCISAGHNFTVMASNYGKVFSYGTSNDKG